MVNYVYNVNINVKNVKVKIIALNVRMNIIYKIIVVWQIALTDIIKDLQWVIKEYVLNVIKNVKDVLVKIIIV
jgi:hypothetical protein